MREIFISCADVGGLSELRYGCTSLPYTLAQISSGMRRTALTTPAIWAAMLIDMDKFYDPDDLHHQKARKYSTMASRASEWLDRAGEVPLYMSIAESTNSYAGLRDDQPHSCNILFDTLFRYSTRWKILRISSKIQDT